MTKKLLPLLLLFHVGCLLNAQEASILRLVGASTVEVILPDSDDPANMAQGEVIPEGSIVMVPEGGKLFLRTFAGTITTVEGGSTIFIEQVEQVGAKEVTRIELRSGDMVAMLDPEKRDVNDYGVRTPKGVAAARGTTFTATVGAGGESSISVVGGAVTFTSPAGTIDLTTGQFMPTPTDAVPNPSPISISAAVSSGALSATTVTTAANAIAQVSALPAATTGLTAAQGTGALTTLVTQVAESGNTNTLVNVTASAARGNPAQAAAVVTAATTADPSSAAQVVATTEAAVQEAVTAGDIPASEAPSVSDLTDAANSGISASGDSSVDSITESEVQQTPAETESSDTPTDSTDAPEIEVPNDNIVISPSS